MNWMNKELLQVHKDFGFFKNENGYIEFDCKPYSKEEIEKIHMEIDLKKQKRKNI